MWYTLKFLRLFEFSEVPGAEASRDGQSSILNLLIGLHSVSEAFSKNVMHLLSAIDVAELAKVLQAVYQPYEGYKQK